MWLLLVAFLSLIVGDGLFVYWLIHDYRGMGTILEDRLALSFMFDAFITLTLLAVHLARNPGRVRWPWFVVFSLLGGLCFGLPFYVWLNRRRIGHGVA